MQPVQTPNCRSWPRKDYLMKSIVTILLILVPSFAYAQSGRVVYEQTVKMDIQLPPEMQDMADQFPSEQTSELELFFDEAASLTKPIQVERPNNTFQSDGIQIKIATSAPDDQTFTNFDSGEVVEKRDFMGRTFLISGEQSMSWKLTDERSTFLGYECQKAIAERDSAQVEAWFTTEIAVPAGPNQYSGLPGLVLVVSVDEGQRSYVAKEIDLEVDVSDKLKAPKKGKQVTQEKFAEIVDEKMKEMSDAHSSAGGNGGTRVFIRRQ